MGSSDLVERLARRRKRRGRLMLGVGALLLLILAALLVVPRYSGLDFAVTFKSANSLKRGDPVLLQGIVIGQVRGVDFADGGVVRVDVHLPREHRERVRSGDMFLIVNPSFPLNTGSMALEVFPGKEGAPPLQRGAVLSGANHRAEIWLGQAGTSVRNLTEAIRGAATSLADEAARLFPAEKVEQMRTRLTELKEEATRIATGYYLEHAEEVGAAKKRLQEGFDEAKRLGRHAAAEKFREAAEMLDNQQASKSK